MQKLKLILFFTLIFCKVHAQIFNTIPVTLPDTTVFKLDIDEEKYRSELDIRYANRFGLKNRFKEFTEQTVENKLKWSNSVYLYDLYYRENAYLKKVAKACLNDSNSIFSNRLKVHIVKDPSINAFTLEDETIYATIGFLADAENEAEIAAVFAHEIGHVKNMHSHKRYKKIKNLSLWIFFNHLSGLSILGTDYLAIGNFFHGLRQQEKQSDDYVIKLFKKNNYHKKNILSIEKKFTELEKKEKQKKNYHKYSDLYRTHPKSEKRYNNLKKASTVIKSDFKKNFIIDSVKFFELKQKAIYENLFLNLKQSNYDDCIESAYYQFLTSKNNEYVNYVLFTSIQRKLALDSSLHNKNFITSSYKFYKKNINQCLHLIYGSKIDTNLISNKTIIKTWDDAYSFFYKICNEGSINLKSYVQKKLDSSININSITSKFEKYIVNQINSKEQLSATNPIPVYSNAIYEKRFFGKDFYTIPVIQSDLAGVLKDYLFNLSAAAHQTLDSTFIFLNYDSLNNYDKEMLVPKYTEIDYKITLNATNKDNRKNTRNFIFRKSKKSILTFANLKTEFPDLYSYANNKKSNYLIYLDYVTPYSQKRVNNQLVKTYRFNVNYTIIDFKNNTITSKTYRPNYRYTSPYECSIIMEEFITELNKNINLIKKN